MFFPPLSRQRLYSSPVTYVTALKDILLGNTYKGNDVRKLEEKISIYTNANNVTCVNQARLGIYLAVKAVINKSKKKKIILSPYTIYDIVNVVICAGGQPVFCDIEKDTCNINPAGIKKLIDHDTAAILVTHLHGLVCDMALINEICKGYDVKIIEDAAQAAGARYFDQAVGTLGDLGVYSFGMMKNINGLYGGAILSNSDEYSQFIDDEIENFTPTSRLYLFKRAIFGLVLDIVTLPSIFRVFTYWIFRYGYLHNIGPVNALSRSEENPKLLKQLPDIYKKKISQTQSRIAIQNFKCIDEHSEIRIKIAEIYFDILSDVPEIVLPPKRGDKSHLYMVFPIQVNDREELLRHLFIKGRDCIAQHLRNCADLGVFNEFAKECPNARYTADATILLPTYPRYGVTEAEKTANEVRLYYLK